MLRSVNMRYSRRFSSSKAFIWLIIDASMPPYLARHLINRGAADLMLAAQLRHRKPALRLSQFLIGISSSILP